MTSMEKYTNIDDLSDKIYQLRADGIKDSDMIVVSKDRFQATFLRYTNVGFKKANGNMWDTVVAKFLDEDREERVLNQLNDLNLNHQDFKDAVDKGEILLVVRNNKNKDTKSKTSQSQEDEPTTYSSTVDVSSTKDDVASKDETTNKHGITDAKKVEQQKAHAEAKKKHDSYMDAAEIVESDGSRRTVSLNDETYTIVNMEENK